MTTKEQPSKIMPPEMANFLAIDTNNIYLNQLIELSKQSIIIQQKNQEILLETQKLQQKILRELKDDGDLGEVLRASGTVTTTEFTIINTIKDPGHPVKAFELTNDGNNTIYVGHNVVQSGEGADIIDINSDISRFDEILSGEDVIYRYNRHKIRNVYMLAKVAASTFRIKLIW